MSHDDRRTGADPVIGEDGLPTSPVPVPRWFTVIVIAAVVGSFAGAFVALVVIR